MSDMWHLDLETAHRLLAGSLTADEQRHWNEHVAQCDTCRRLLAQERAWGSLLEPAESAAPVIDARERLVAHLESLTPRPSRARAWRRRVECALCTLAAAAIAGLITSLLVPDRAGREAAESLGVSAPTQARVLARFDELRTIEHAEWLAEDYDAVRTLHALLGERPR